MQSGAIFNGTNGTLWLSSDTTETAIGSMQTFQLKQANEFEDVNEADFYGKKKRFLGYELTGTISKYKVDHEFLDVMERYTKGDVPEISLIGKAYNPNTDRMEVIKVIGVTFDEADIMNLEQKTATREELPFSAESYKWIAKV